jgi:hypothetical protein
MIRSYTLIWFEINFNVVYLHASAWHLLSRKLMYRRLNPHLKKKVPELVVTANQFNMLSIPSISSLRVDINFACHQILSKFSSNPVWSVVFTVYRHRKSSIKNYFLNFIKAIFNKSLYGNPNFFMSLAEGRLSFPRNSLACVYNYLILRPVCS